MNRRISNLTSSAIGGALVLAAAFVAVSVSPATATPIYFSGAGEDQGSQPVSFSGILDGVWNGVDAYDIVGVLSGSETVGLTTGNFSMVLFGWAGDNKLYGTQWGPLLPSFSGVALLAAGLGGINTFSDPSLSTAMWQDFASHDADGHGPSAFLLTSFDAHAIGEPVEVPEPLTMAAFAAGLAGVASLRRRKATKNVVSVA